MATAQNRYSYRQTLLHQAKQKSGKREQKTARLQHHELKRFRILTIYSQWLWVTTVQNTF
jgi:hypothetical protein